MFTVWDIGKYVYCNCLLTKLWHHRFKLTWSFQSNCFPAWPKTQDKNLNILRTRRAFKANKRHFPYFLKGFQMQKILRPFKVPLKQFMCSFSKQLGYFELYNYATFIDIFMPLCSFFLFWFCMIRSLAYQILKTLKAISVVNTELSLKV